MNESRAGEIVDLACSRCGEEVTLPAVPDQPGFVSIKPITGWTAPPLLCPECSRDVPRQVEHDPAGGGHVQVAHGSDAVVMTTTSANYTDRRASVILTATEARDIGNDLLRQADAVVLSGRTIGGAS